MMLVTLSFLPFLPPPLLPPNIPETFSLIPVAPADSAAFTGDSPAASFSPAFAPAAFFASPPPPPPEPRSPSLSVSELTRFSALEPTLPSTADMSFSTSPPSWSLVALPAPFLLLSATVTSGASTRRALGRRLLRRLLGGLLRSRLLGGGLLRRRALGCGLLRSRLLGRGLLRRRALGRHLLRRGLLRGTLASRPALGGGPLRRTLLGGRALGHRLARGGLASGCGAPTAA